jgi:hypothetical protein
LAAQAGMERAPPASPENLAGARAHLLEARREDFQRDDVHSVDNATGQILDEAAGNPLLAANPAEHASCFFQSGGSLVFLVSRGTTQRALQESLVEAEQEREKAVQADAAWRAKQRTNANASAKGKALNIPE